MIDLVMSKEENALLFKSMLDDNFSGFPPTMYLVGGNETCKFGTDIRIFNTPFDGNHQQTFRRRYVIMFQLQ
jgi:hypothetical protein